MHQFGRVKVAYDCLATSILPGNSPGPVLCALNPYPAMWHFGGNGGLRLWYHYGVWHHRHDLAGSSGSFSKNGGTLTSDAAAVGLAHVYSYTLCPRTDPPNKQTPTHPPTHIVEEPDGLTLC